MEHSIRPLYSSLLRNEDRITISDRVYLALKSQMSEDKDCMTFLSMVKAQNSLLRTGLIYTYGPNAFTSRLKNIASERAAIIRFIKKSIDAQLINVVDHTQQKAAQKLAFDFNNTICANKMRNYACGSSTAKTILRRCAIKQNREHIKLLGLAAALAKLAQTQKNFMDTYIEKVSTGHEIKNINISKTSNKLLDNLNYLFNHIVLQATLKKGTYIAAIETINVIIKGVVKEARKRKTRKQNKNNETFKKSVDSSVMGCNIMDTSIIEKQVLRVV